MRTSEVLNRAADIVQEFGWIQGTWGLSYTGEPVLPVCTEGAILAAAGLGERWWNASRVDDNCAGADQIIETCSAAISVRDYLGEIYLSAWNDQPGRTATEVIEVLRACAAIEQARETPLDASLVPCTLAGVTS